jgi:hypothetical protein
VSPDLSVVVVGDGARTLRPVLRALGAQTIRDRMELVVVAPGAAHDELRRELPEELAAVRFVDRGTEDGIGPARAAGLRAASAPLVALSETHAFAPPGWAATLVGAQPRECVALAPVVENGNPATALSWANLLIDYGPFLHRPGRDGCEPTDFLPWHNTCFRREAIAGYGDRLDRMLEFETELHDDLRRRGGGLAVQRGIALSHVNVSSRRSWLPERWHAGRVFAAGRARRWTRARRLAYALAFPAFPLLRLWRVVGHARAAGRAGVLPRALAPAAVGLVVQAAGEAAGYLAGSGGSLRAMTEYEVRRLDHLAPGERPEAASA